MKFEKRQVYLVLSRLLIIICTAGIVYLGLNLLTKNNRFEKNSFELDLDKFNQIEPDMISYSLEKEFPVSRQHLFGITTDNNNNIYVSADYSIIKYNSAGNEISSFSVDEPVRCMVFSENDRFYVASRTKIFSYDTDGVKLDVLLSLDDNAIITSVAVSGELIFIADAGNKIVHVYNDSGEFKFILGHKDDNNGVPWFIVPSPYFDLAIDSNKKLWVVNPGKHELDQYTLEGELISSWTANSKDIEGFCGCCNPIHFSLDTADNFITSEKGFVRIKKYNSAGVFNTVVAGPDSFADNAEMLDLTVDSQNRVLVLDAASGHVKIFVDNELSD